MKHAVIVGHPDPHSFTMSLARSYADTVSALRQTCTTHDLYRIDFDPRLKLPEMPNRVQWAPAADVHAERQLIYDADVFAFIYPLWFNAPPAIIKG